MTAHLREAMALAPWGPVTVKKEEEEEEDFPGQASGQQVLSENMRVWPPGDDPQRGLDVGEREAKVNTGLEGMRGREPETPSGFRGDTARPPAHPGPCSSLGPGPQPLGTGEGHSPLAGVAFSALSTGASQAWLHRLPGGVFKDC